MKTLVACFVLLSSYSTLSNAQPQTPTAVPQDPYDVMMTVREKTRKHHPKPIDYDFLYQVEQSLQSPDFGNRFRKLVSVNPPHPIEHPHSAFILGLLVDRLMLATAATDPSLTAEQSEKVTTHLASKFSSYVNYSSPEEQVYVTDVFKEVQSSDPDVLTREMILLTKIELKIGESTNYAAVLANARKLNRQSFKTVGLPLFLFCNSYMALLAALGSIDTGHTLQHIGQATSITSSVLLLTYATTAVVEYFTLKKDSKKTVINAVKTLEELRSIIWCRTILGGNST
jgi:hypothetical protein